MTTRPFMLILLCLASRFAVADPIHAAADGAYWHHDSGFVFIAKIGEFGLSGIPQDVAGSRDAVAYYARTLEGERTVIAVSVYPAESAASYERGDESGRRVAESSVVVEPTQALSAMRVVFAAPPGGATTVRYFVTKRDWRICIEVTLQAADADELSGIDAFVRGQRWESLAS